MTDENDDILQVEATVGQWREMLRIVDTQAAAIARVRELCDGSHDLALLQVGTVRRALATAPEQGRCVKCWCDECQCAAPEHTASATVREHAKRRGALDGADAQALEGALSQAERALAAADRQLDAQVAALDQANARAEAEWREKQAALEKLDTANAKVAELEAALHHGDDVDAEMRDKLSAANARADAAEQRRLVYQRLCDEREQALQRAESEAASLRAEVERYRSALAELGIELVDDE